MRPGSRLAKTGYAAAGLVAGAALATTLSAHAASSTPTPSTPGSSSSATEDPHPGDNGADGIPESQEQHAGGHDGGHGLDLSGTVTAVGTSTVTIKTSTGTKTYTVTSNSDIDKNGESTLSKLVVGDAVHFSVMSSNAAQIDKLHAGDEAKNMPQRGGPAPQPSSGTAAPSSFT
jgi:hypothetical protein